MEVSIKLDNAKELEQVFRRAPGIAMKEYKDSLERIATSMVETSMKYAPVNKGQYESTGLKGRRGSGGNLRQSIRKFPYGSTGFIVRVGAEYGVYVDQGTKPHVIVPRNSRYLVFKGRNGEWVRTRRVNHPGTKPTFFFTNAAAETERYANREMSAAMDRVIKKLK